MTLLQLGIYIYTRFQKHCNLKNIYTYIHLLSSQRENKRINMKTKGTYICIYIFQVAMFLKTGVYIYVYIHICIYIYITIILLGLAGYQMIDNQRGA